MISLRDLSRYRRWMAGLLLAAYGSAGILGYGLHAVWDCDHDCLVHTHPEGVTHSHSHVHGHDCHHHHGHAAATTTPTDEHATLNFVVDDCPICEFLVQAQSPFVMEFPAICLGITCSALPLLANSYVAPFSGTHHARGPPLG